MNKLRRTSPNQQKVLADIEDVASTYELSVDPQMDKVQRTLLTHMSKFLDVVGTVVDCIAKTSAAGLYASYYEAVYGKDFCDGSSLDGISRAISSVELSVDTASLIGWKPASAAGLAFSLNRIYKKAAPVFKKIPTKQVTEMMKLTYDLMGSSISKLGLEGAFKRVRGVLDSAKKIRLSKPDRVKQLAETASKAGVKPGKFGETLENIGKSDDFARAVRSTLANKPMFYVKSSGEAIPSTAYRYVGSDAKYLDEFIKNGHIPKGNYYSFDKIDDMTQASSKLQVPHDARYRAEFDTLPYVDKTKIPNGDWGEADYLEPITKDFPGFGQGGATQAVIDREVSVSKIIDLKTGQVVFER